MAVATGNGVRIPLTLGPNRSAAAVNENTSTPAEVIRSGRSHLGAAFANETGPCEGKNARATNSAATAITNAPIGPTWTRYISTVTIANDDHPISRHSDQCSRVDVWA
jgi:hypothetical protein